MKKKGKNVIKVILPIAIIVVSIVIAISLKETYTSVFSGNLVSASGSTTSGSSGSGSGTSGSGSGTSGSGSGTSGSGSGESGSGSGSGSEVTKTYTVNYNGNGFTSGNTANSIHTVGKSQYLTANGYERKYTVVYDYNFTNSSVVNKEVSYTFKNWNTNAAGTGTSYNNQESVIDLSTTNGDVITLYAQWNSNSVTYLPTSRTGYTFGGWYANPSCSGDRVDSSGVYTPTTNVTLYAKWIPNKYTVKYNGNGSTIGTMSDSTHTYGVSQALNTNNYERIYTVTYNHNYSDSSNTTRTSTYDFIGWATTADGIKAYNDKESVINLSSVNGAIVNLFAQWSNTNSKVTYIPTRTGYTFAGWYTNPAYTGNRVDTNGEYLPTESITLYARWTANTYTVKYDGNGATGGSTADSIHTYDIASELTANGFTRSYNVIFDHNYTNATRETKTSTYTFKNWNTNATGTGTSYSNGVTVRNLATSGSINLYAQWDAKEVVSLPVRTGYTFAGWFTNSECTGNRVDENGVYTPTANITLYAKWTPNRYTVTYNGNGATGGETANSIHEYDTEKELTSNGYKKEYNVTFDHNYDGSTDKKETVGYTFNGWSKTATGNKEYDNSQRVLNLNVNSGAIVTLFANWSSNNANYVPTRTGYTFGGWYTTEACQGSRVDTNGQYTPTADITLYAKWTVNNYNYTVNYLEKNTNKVLSTAKTGSAAYGTNIIGANEVVTIKGYAYVDSNEITVSETETNNVINVYYQIDDTQRKDLSYTVEYYRGGQKVDEDTQVERKSVQVLEDDTLTVDKSKINVTNKYEGYKFDKTEPTTIPNTVNNGDVIKVYYVIDNENVKTLSYTVEYYKDGEKVLADSYTESKEVQILESNNIEVKPIDTANDKYYGYKFERTEPATIPSTVEDKTVIKVHYVTDENQTKDLSYIVEYYKDGVLVEGDTQIETKKVQVLADDTLTVDKSKINLSDKYVAFKLDRTEPSEIPDTVENGTTLKVYYVTNIEKSGYKIEYFYGIKAEPDKVDYIEVNKNTVIEDADIADRISQNVKEGYEHFLTLNTPLKVSDNLDANVIKVYYKEKTATTAVYSIEYYYDGVIDNSKSIVETVDIGTVITREMVQAKADENMGEGYELVTIINAPLTVTENAGNNVIKIFYKTAKPEPTPTAAYRIEYYYDNEIDNNKSDIAIVDVGTVITKEIVQAKADANVKENFKLLTIINVPLTVSENIDNNVIKVFYITKGPDPIPTVAYQVEYYYDGEIDNNRTDVENAKVGTVVSAEELEAKIAENAKEEYEYLTTVNLPLTVTENVYNNVIKVFYVKTDPEPNPTPKSAYSIEYYYNGELDTDKTDVIVAEVGTVVSKEEVNKIAEANIKENYKVLALINAPLTVSENVNNNVIKIFYVKDEPTPDPVAGYKIEYYYDGVRDNARTNFEEEKVGLVITKEEINGKIAANEIAGYEYLTTVNLPLTISESIDNNVIKVFYVKTDPEPVPTPKSAYSIEYYYDNELDTDKTDVVVAEVGTVVTKEEINARAEGKAGSDYELVTIINVPLVVSENIENNVIKVFYIEKLGPDPVEKSAYRIEYYYDDEMDTTKSELHQVEVGTIVTKAEIQAKAEANVKSEYEYLSMINVPLTVTSNIDNNVIKVFYTKIEPNPGPDPVEKSAYRIEYYYDNEIDANKTELIKTEVGTVVTKAEVQTKAEANVKDGYRLLSFINAPLTVVENADSNVIKVYYTKVIPDVPVENKVAYRIEYYYDYEMDNEKSVLLEADKGTIISDEEAMRKAEENLKEGFKLIKVTNTPLTITENIDNNVIKVYYITDNPEPGPEPEPNTETAYSIEYYYDFEIDNEKTELIKSEIGTVVTKVEVQTKAEANVKSGYKFLSMINAPLTVSENVNNNVIKVYYVSETDPDNPDPVPNTKVGYRIEYYYDEEIDNDRSELIKVEVGTVIGRAEIEAKAEANKKENYKLLDIVKVPLTAGENIDNNVIKVYYGKIETDPDEPDPVETETRYRIEYYYEGEIDNEKTELVKVEKGTTIEKSAIDAKVTANTKDGYGLLTIINVPLKVTDNIANNIIKVYYEKVTGSDPVPETKFGYRVEYYYDNEIDNSKSDLVLVEKDTKVTKADLETKIEANRKEGYKVLDTINLPLTVSENIENNVIKVYYIKEMIPGSETDPTPIPNPNVGYRIEYYYDYEIDNEKSQLIEIKVGEKVERAEIEVKAEENKKLGYRLLTIINVPLTASENVENNVIRVYYVKVTSPEDPDPVDNKTVYKVEYYYDNNINNSKTQLVEVDKGSVITKDTIQEKIDENKSEGYIFLTTVNLPLTAGEDVENNVIKVFYVSEPNPDEPVQNKTAYKLEYYYAGELDTTKTIVVETELGKVVTEDELKDKIDANTVKGYELLEVVNVPLTTTENIDNNVIKIFYKEKIKQVPVDPSNPDGETKEEENNDVAYRIEYYYEDQIDNSKTNVIEVAKGTVISEAELSEKITANTKDGYKYLGIVNVPLTVSENVGNNVIKVYYILKEITPDPTPDNPDPEPIPNTKTGYKVEYYFDNVLDASKTELIQTEVGSVIERAEIEAKVSSKNKEGYKFLSIVNAPLTTTDNIANNVIKVFYESEMIPGPVDPSNPDQPVDPVPNTKVGYRIEYYYDNNINNSKTELETVEKGTIINSSIIDTKIRANKTEGYKFLTTVNMPLTVSEVTENNVIKIFYIKEKIQVGPGEIVDNTEVGYIIEYYYNNVLDNNKTEVVSARIGEIIGNSNIEAKVQANTIENYRLLGLINVPLKVTENTSSNVVKVYYVSTDPIDPDSKVGYKVEYYYNNELDSNRTQLLEIAKGETITRETIQENVNSNTVEGYELLDVINVPFLAGEDSDNNVIKVYYKKSTITVPVDPENPDGPTKEEPNNNVGYKIEYYYDGRINNTKTELVEIAKGEEITKSDIGTKVVANVVDGYKLLEIVNVPLTISENISNNVIKVYYVKEKVEVPVDPENPDGPTKEEDNNNVGYIVEYYYADVKDNSKTELVEVAKGSIIERAAMELKALVNAKEGYKLLDIVNVPLIAGENITNNVIKVYYAKSNITVPVDPEDPDGPTKEEPNSNVAYRLEYYYDNEIDTSRTELIEVAIGTKLEEKDIQEKANENRKEGYKVLDITNVPLTVKETIQDNVIKVFYIKEKVEVPVDPENPDGPTKEEDNNNVGYKVEYYYNNNLDNNKTEVIEVKVGDVVSNATINAKAERNRLDGYKVALITNAPLTVSENIKENVIKVYYVRINPDEPEQTTTIYRIEYYYEDKFDSSKTDIMVANVGDIISEEAIAENINTKKLEGYKLLEVANVPLTATVDAQNNVIKVYYVKEKVEVPVDPENPDGPTKEEDNKTLAYRIEYYFDRVIDNQKTDVIKANVGDVITREVIEAKANEKNEVGYKVSTIANVPLTIEDIDNSVIKVYYEKTMVPGPVDPDNPDQPVDPVPNTKVGYRIEYYYDEKIDNTKTEFIEVEKDTEITREQISAKIEANRTEGYKLLILLNTPLIAGEDSEKNVIKVYYEKEIPVDPDDPNPVETKTAYSVEYYYDNKLDSSRTQLVKADIGTVINRQNIEESAEANKIAGYKLLTILNTPLTLGENAQNNVIKVCYVKERPDNPIEEVKTGYRIEYYYDNVLDGTKTELTFANEGTLVQRSIINAKAEVHLKEGYKLLAILNAPLSVSENIDENVIKIYYVREKITVPVDPENPDGPTKEIDNNRVAYKVEYYYENRIDKSRTELIEAENGTIVEKADVEKKAVGNVKEGYKLLTIANVPLVTSENVDNNVIKVYYQKSVITVPVDPENPDGEQHEVDNNRVGYTVEYYYDSIIDNTRTEVIEVDKDTEITKADIEKKADANKQDGYKLLSIVNTPLVASENTDNNIIKVYFAKTTITVPVDPNNPDGPTKEIDNNRTAYTVEYYYDNNIDNRKTELVEIEKDTIVNRADIEAKVTANVKDGYKLYTIVNTPLAVGENIDNNIIKVYYIKEKVTVPVDPENPDGPTKEVDNNKFGYKVEYYYSDVRDNSRTEVIDTDLGRVINKSDIDSKITNNKVDGYKLLAVVNTPLKVEESVDSNVIKVYYIKEMKDGIVDPENPDKPVEPVENTAVGYIIEYYYDNKLDNEKTEVVETEPGQIIEKAQIERKVEANIKEGYKFLTIINAPLIAGDEVENNIIKVYYQKSVITVPVDPENPDGPTQDVENTRTGYRVEYYYDNNIDNSRSELIEVEIGKEISDEEISRRVQDNKIDGYKVLSVLNIPLTAGENVNNNVIKVYYVKEKITVPVDPEDPNGPTKEIDNTTSAYRVEYYYDNIINNEKSELIEANTGDVITKEAMNIKANDNNEAGFKVLTVLNAPLTISENVDNNIIRIYYIKVQNPDDPTTATKAGYKLEYYYDSVIDNTRSEVVIVNKDEVISEESISNHIEENKKEGYKFFGLANAPLTVEENVDNNIIKVYYVKEKVEIPVDPENPDGPKEEVDNTAVGYKVEYYYNGVRDNENSEILEGKANDVITEDSLKDKIESHKPEGLESVSTLGLPLTLTEDLNQNIVKVYYVVESAEKEEATYTIEYYYDNVKDEKVTENLKDIAGNVIKDSTISENIKKHQKIGYKVAETVNLPLVLTTNTVDNVIKVYYVKDEFEYTVEYYFEGVKDESKTVKKKALYQDVIEECEDKVITGYTFDKSENLPLTITENSALNVIKVYYVKTSFSYTINYYYDGILDEDNRVIKGAKYQEVINNYVDKVKDGFVLEKVENLPLTISENADNNVINVYYVRKDAEVIVKYVDKATGEEIADSLVLEGKVFDEYNVTEDGKEIDGYTLIETPSDPIGQFTEEKQEKVYAYAKNTKVVVKYLEKDEGNKVLAEEDVIEGYEGKEYETQAKEIENYTFAESTSNTKGKMPRNESEVIYYYLQNTKVIVKHIDKNTNEVLETVEQAGKVGDTYTAKEKDFAGYIIEERPEKETVIMTKDIIVLNYYYKKLSEGVLEKHIDRVTGEVLDFKVYEGREGTKYKTSSKDFEGYDVLEEYYPENAEGEMGVDLIEVKYYYIRKTTVKVEHIDSLTNQIIKERIEVKDDETGEITYEEKDSTQYIYGHENNTYTTSEKDFEGYVVVKEMYPENANGTMKVERKADGTVNTETLVRYYYAKTSAGVTEKHIDVKTGELIEEPTTHTGYEGDAYSIKAKEFDGYDLVEDKLPTNAEGNLEKEEIIVEYYYIRKVTVVVEHIDINTEKVILEKVEQNNKLAYSEKDSTEYINGHEGDAYSTKAKDFEGYMLLEDRYPENSQGIMTVKEDENGNVVSTINVRYYYVHESKGVVESHIDAITGEKLEEDTRYEGKEGDSYETKAKTFEGYDLVESRLPANAKGNMGKDLIEVKYYYVRKTTVTVEFRYRATNEKIAEDVKITGHEGDKFTTSSKTIKGYEVVDSSSNTDGTMTREGIVVKYFYDKVEENNNNNNNNNNNQSSGDNNGSNNNGAGNNNGNGSNNGTNNNGNNNATNGTNNNNSNGTNNGSNSNNSNNNNSLNSSNKGTTSNNNNSSSNNSSSSTGSKTPSTGDMLPIIAGGIILVVIVINIIIAIIRKKKNSKDKED